ncbi:hypothetical protein OPV22_006591 [Ensete ventricosum]|uniref:Uncharacterized protein n=1 Tax=Ensete ventricosum TaxID=4639 RepID=A0AAV8RFE0_ENSVE|nr:hypothetical protein OPV22_006591 [Ensete ventricosum]
MWNPVLSEAHGCQSICTRHGDGGRWVGDEISETVPRKRNPGPCKAQFAIASAHFRRKSLCLWRWSPLVSDESLQFRQRCTVLAEGALARERWPGRKETRAARMVRALHFCLPPPRYGISDVEAVKAL